MKNIRQPAVAGAFYPANAQQLHKMLKTFLAAKPSAGPSPKAIIAPHAGYIYSGPVAASAYVRVRPLHAVIKRVVLLGPSHRVGFHGVAVPSADLFNTPLGSIAVDRNTVDGLLALPFVQLMDEAHRLEHSLEVHLPFLQEVLDRFSLVPLVAGDARPAQIGALLEEVWGGPETLIVVSSDLSHYYDYETARRMDRATSRAIETLADDALDVESACGRVPVSGLLYAARRHGLTAHTVDLRNSGDTAGPHDRVVGYGAYVFA